jgi:hypothetical protein
MGMNKLLFGQTSGVFFVWKTENDKRLATFLRKRKGVSEESQIDRAILGGRIRAWELVGIGYWRIQPVTIRNITQTDSPSEHRPSINVTNILNASLLWLKKIPERERRSTEQGAKEMREQYIPTICDQIRKILWESDPVI